MKKYASYIIITVIIVAIYFWYKNEKSSYSESKSKSDTSPQGIQPQTSSQEKKETQVSIPKWRVPVSGNSQIFQLPAKIGRGKTEKIDWQAAPAKAKDEYQLFLERLETHKNEIIDIYNSPSLPYSGQITPATAIYITLVGWCMKQGYYVEEFARGAPAAVRLFNFTSETTKELRRLYKNDKRVNETFLDKRDVPQKPNMPVYFDLNLITFDRALPDWQKLGEFFNRIKDRGEELVKVYTPYLRPYKSDLIVDKLGRIILGKRFLSIEDVKLNRTSFRILPVVNLDYGNKENIRIGSRYLIRDLIRADIFNSPLMYLENVPLITKVNKKGVIEAIFFSHDEDPGIGPYGDIGHARDLLLNFAPLFRVKEEVDIEWTITDTMIISAIILTIATIVSAGSATAGVASILNEIGTTAVSVSSAAGSVLSSVGATLSDVALDVIIQYIDEKYPMVGDIIKTMLTKSTIGG